MSELRITQAHARAAVVGGCVLGGGGGGSVEFGMRLAAQATQAGPLTLLSQDELDGQAILFNVSAVGAPSAKEAFASPEDYRSTIENLARFTGRSPAGIVTNEMGGLATVNGWLQSAETGIPIVDLPSNGRAHPTGVMGAMGLHRDKDYLSVQAAAGGDPAQGRHIELVVSASLSSASQMVRQAAVCAGGMVAVARNPVSVAYARENAAPGAVL